MFSGDQVAVQNIDVSERIPPLPFAVQAGPGDTAVERDVFGAADSTPSRRTILLTPPFPPKAGGTFAARMSC
jgi:hypothetical protein